MTRNASNGFLLALVAGLLAIPLHAADSVALPPVINLDRVSAEDLKGWSDAQADGAIKYRSVHTGAVQTLRIKAWWDEPRLRPPEKQIVVLTVQYKDTVQTPAIFYSFGGLGSYGGPGEILRFGGDNDGKWKSVDVPVSWDMFIRMPKDRAHTSIGIRTTAELPVASVTFRLAEPADEAAYNALTRAWVARLAGAAGAIKGNATVQDFGTGPVSAFPWPVSKSLLPSDTPRKEWIGKAIRIRMCENEFQPATFGVYAGVALKGVDFTVSPLTGAAGTLQAEVSRRTAEYTPAHSGIRPLRLWPAFPVDVAAGQSQLFMVDVHTTRGVSKPGLYKGEIAIACAAGKTTLPLEVEVLPVNLLTMDEAGLSMGGCVAGLLPAHDIAFQTAWNQNGINLWFSGVQPGMSFQDGKLQLDWTYMDEWMADAKARGLKNVVYFLGGNPYGFPSTMTLPRSLFTALGKGSNQDFVKAQGTEQARDKMLAELRPSYIDFCRQLYAHSRAANWPEIIVTPFDEPAKWVQGPGRKQGNAKPGVIGTGPWIKSYFKDCCAAIHEAAPEMHIYGSIHHNHLPQEDGFVFVDDIDVFCTNAIHEDPKLGDKVRAKKKIFWQYSGLSGNASDARYTFGFFFAAYDSRGSLCWAYNWGDGFEPPGKESWIYGWQTPFDTIPSPYFVNLREGWDDRRIIETYRKTFAADPDAMAVLNKILKEAAGSRTSGGEDTVDDFWAGVNDTAKLDQWRDALLDRLAKK
jgi:hypothetical protein